jgi:hypothetical protein
MEIADERQALIGQPGVWAELKGVNRDERRLTVVSWSKGCPAA